MARLGTIAWLLLIIDWSVAGGAVWHRGPTSMPPLNSQAAVYDEARGVVVMFGGDDGSFALRADTWEYDGTSWSMGATAPSGLLARKAHAMVFDTARNLTVLFGGVGPTNPLGDTWEYDGVSWRQGPPTGPSPRSFAAMAFDQSSGATILMGGFATGMMNDTWSYDGTSWTQLSPSASPTARAEHAMIYDQAGGRVFLFGGFDGSSWLRDAWAYDGSTWQSLPPPPAGLTVRSGHSLVYDPATSAIILFGGYSPPSPQNDTWILDAAGWRQGPSAPPGLVGRRYAGMAYDTGRSVAVLYGGLDSALAPLRDTWELSSAWQQGSASPGPTGRSGHAAVYDTSRSRIVLFGGADASSGALDDTWEYDGASWVKGPAAPAGLAPRYRHAMAFDSLRNVTVLFGGMNPALRNDVWEYNGTSWTAGTAAPAGLTKRADHAMTFDSKRGRTILFGGRSGAGKLNDTWEYDGVSWTAGPAAPPALSKRSDAAITFDDRRNVVVLFGGIAASRKNDTWEYDGVSWTAGPAASISPRYGHALCFDSESGLAVLFGGTDGSAYKADTWLYDGSSWVAGPTPPAALAAREGHILTWDASRARGFLFAGFNGAYLFDSWELGEKQRLLAGEGPGPTNANRVRTFDSVGATDADFLAYQSGAFGVNVASGTIRQQGQDDILTGPGPGAIFGPQVRAFQASSKPIAKVNFYAYGTLRFGVKPSSAELDADGFQEILSGAGPGDVFGPHVRGFNFDGNRLTAIKKVSFFAYKTLKYGVNPASGDVEADGFAEILTGPGPGSIFGPQVRGFDFDGTVIRAIQKINFLAFSGIGYGAALAGGDVDADSMDELAASPGPGGTTSYPGRARGFDFDGVKLQPLAGFDVTAFPASLYGGRLALGNLRGLNAAELAASPGADPSLPSDIAVYRYDGAGLVAVPPTVTAFPPDLYGVNVSALAY